jgi:hypothetical protein
LSADPEAVFFRRLTGRLKHFCPDWDYMAIDETCQEFSSCLCDKTALKKARKELSTQ